MEAININWKNLAKRRYFTFGSMNEYTAVVCNITKSTGPGMPSDKLHPKTMHWRVDASKTYYIEPSLHSTTPERREYHRDRLLHYARCHIGNKFYSCTFYYTEFSMPYTGGKSTELQCPEHVFFIQVLKLAAPDPAYDLTNPFEQAFLPAPRYTPDEDA